MLRGDLFIQRGEFGLWKPVTRASVRYINEYSPLLSQLKDRGGNIHYVTRNQSLHRAMKLHL
jgi:hypothetical protein